MCKSLHKPTDNNSNTINITPTVSLPSNTTVCSNYYAYIFLLIERIGSLEQSFDTQLQSLTQMSPVKERNANNESDILIDSLQDTIHKQKKN